MRNAILWALLVTLAAAGPSAAQGEIDGHTYLPEDRWGRLGPEANGKHFYVEGRWNGIRLEDVSLYKTPSEGFLFIKAGTPLQGRLSGDRDTRGEHMQKRTSTVRLFSTAKRQGNRCVLWVNKAYKLEDDVVRYRQALEALPADADPTEIKALAERIRALVARYEDDALGEVARVAVQRELQARRAQLAAGDNRGALHLAERMLEVDDIDAAIQLLADFEKAADSEWRTRLRQELRRLGAVYSSGTWLAFTEFKRQEGFVQRTNADGVSAWITREWAEFDQVIASERELQAQMVVPARKNELRHFRDAEQGRIVRGQTMAEVRLAAGGELPVLVNHVRALAPGPAAAMTAIWSQWVLADGRRVYFLDQGGGGEVIAFKAAQSAWPR
jgi:hypothetical protein